MKNCISVLFFFLFCFVCISSFAQTAIVRGVILDENNIPVSGVNISFEDNGTLTDENGVYEITIPANKEVSIRITHIAYKDITFKINLEENQEYELNPVLKINVEQISTVVISGNERKAVEGITTLDPETIRTTPSANAGVEGLLKSLPGVSNNNELSTQYSVRGGNYDENLVYVNEIEVYRPFLIRSGQQEGLSFVNTDLVRNVDFSAGGFQAKFGDKLSSVLDITYRRPTGFNATAELSLLGASVSLDGITKNKKLSAVIGARYRDNSLLVQARDIQTNFRPTFADVQSYISYNISKKFELGFLGNIAINDYDFTPVSRQVNFGTFETTQALVVRYSGQEKDTYKTYFGALKATYKANDKLALKFIASAYHTQEQEYYDILGTYFLGTVNNDLSSDNLGQAESLRGAGAQLTHARNDLDALIYNAQHKGSYISDNHQIDWGVKFTSEDIRDRIQEYEVVDSLGFAVRPSIPDFRNDQPYVPFASPLVPFNSVRGRNNVNINRVSAFAQYSLRSSIGDHELWANIGLRTQQWNVSGDELPSNSNIVFSPRAQLAIKPKWKKDMLFRLSGGFYHQPPFYRELRDLSGAVQPEVNAQQSIHVVLGNDYSFNLRKKPFKLTTEIYYKSLTAVNTYTLENVRIRYQANNDAVAYATGLDMRLNGEFVKGTESWLSLGILKTEENINNRGYIPRPTDQRLKLGVLFQDYVPTIPTLKMYLNMVYQTGLPGGSPNNADPYLFANQRLRDYRRADLGISYIVVDKNNRLREGHILNRFKELSLGFEIFNLFDNNNSITNTFVRDFSNQVQYAIPNFLTPRIFNLRVRMKF